MSLRIPGRMGTPCAASHFDRLIETPVPYRCITAAKISAVAAAIMVAISHSSRWSSARPSTLGTPIPPSKSETIGSAITPDRFSSSSAESQPSVHLDVEFLGDEVEHLLPNPPLGPGVGRTHGVLPGLLLIVGQVMQRGLARLLDLGQRVLVFLDRDRVGVVGRLVDRLVELRADIRWQSAPELGVDDH